MMFMNFGQDRRRRKYIERRVNTNYNNLFRFSEDQIDFLASEFLDESNEHRGGSLSSAHKMKIFLRYVSDPGYQASEAWPIFG